MSDRQETADLDARRVDIGIVTWNTRDLSISAIERLVDATGAIPVRILVRDNGSSDGTAEAIAARFPAVELDAGAENLGFAAGVNTILARSDAPFIFLLNSDAWPAPGALEVLIDAARANPRAAIVAPRLERPNGTPEESTHRFPSLRLALVQALALYRLPRLGDRFLVPGYWGFDRRRVVDWVVGAAWLVRRDALEDVGWLDERYVMYVEDLDWCHRANQRGWEVMFEPAAVVTHLGNASGEQRYADRRTATWLHNTFFFYREAHGRMAALAFRGLNVVAALRLWVVARLRGDRGGAGRWAAHVRGSLSSDVPTGAMRHLPPELGAASAGSGGVGPAP
jgi:N-acetylglucosaminyl-diphospho-decaprenol L-rhamnosyltransferase